MNKIHTHSSADNKKLDLAIPAELSKLFSNKAMALAERSNCFSQNNENLLGKPTSLTLNQDDPRWGNDSLRKYIMVV